jgi:hypothetical protein
MVVIHESFQESNVWRVGQVPSHTGFISIRVTATLLVMSDSLSLQTSHSMFGVLFEEMDMDMVMVILSL